GGWVTAAGSAADFPRDVPSDAIRRVADGVLMPGLVNLHCHLELTGLHDRLDSGQRFPDWVSQLRAQSTGFTASDYCEAARAGIGQLIAGGCTTVLDVGNTGEALSALADSSLRAFACVEVLGLDPAQADARHRAAADLSGQAARAPAPGTAHDNDSGSGRFQPGLAPHAAYSMSPALLRRTIDHQRARGLPVTIHAAESREEAELFASGTGPLADYCRAVYPDAPRHTGT